MGNANFLIQLFAKTRSQSRRLCSIYKGLGSPQRANRGVFGQRCTARRVMSNSIEKVPFYKEIGIVIRDNTFAFRKNLPSLLNKKMPWN